MLDRLSVAWHHVNASLLLGMVWMVQPKRLVWLPSKRGMNYRLSLCSYVLGFTGRSAARRHT